MSASSFNPGVLTVTVGTTVQWRDASGLAHTVTAAPGTAETFDLAVGANGAVSHGFTTAGTYAYYCRVHGSPTAGMRGTVTVTGSSARN